jgi:hypothetical protein
MVSPWAMWSFLSSKGVPEAAWRELLPYGRVRVVGLGFSGRKPSPTLRSAAMVVTFLERRSTCWWHHCGAPHPEVRGYRGENHVQLWTSDDNVIGVVPSLGALFSSQPTRLVGGALVVLLMHSSGGGAQDLC